MLMAKLFERKSTSLTISEFYDNFIATKYRFDTSYQRNSDIWSEDKKSFLIDSIFKNYPMPVIFLRPNIDTETGRTIYDVVDGKQRLETIVGFIKGEIPLTTYFSEDNFIDASNFDAARKISGLNFNEIKENSKEFVDYIRQFWTYTLNVEYLYESDDELIATVFDRLNRNGEPLTRQELRKAKYADSVLLKILNELAKNEFWQNKLGRLKSNRMEDVEFISELFFIVLTNSIMDSKQDILDDLYRKYNNKTEDIDSGKKEFINVISYIENLNIDFTSNKRLCWTTHLYTLFTFAWVVNKHKIKPENVEKNLKDFYEKYYDRNTAYENELATYKEASSSRTRSKQQREKRLKALLQYCHIDEKVEIPK